MLKSEQEPKTRRVLGHRTCKDQLILKNPEPIRVLAKKSFVRPAKQRVSKIVNKNKNNLPNFIPAMPKINIVPDEVAMFTKEILSKDMNDTIKQLNESGFTIDVDEYEKCIDNNINRYSKRSIDFIGQIRIDQHDPFNILLDEFKGNMDEFNRFKSQFVHKPKKIQHITWCCICGGSANLLNCKYCCIAFHEGCNNTKRISVPVFTSKSRSNSAKIKNDLKKFCPQCKSGQTLCSGDIVWHKLDTFSWWPARILPLRDKPKCLIYPPTPNHFPIYYYGEKNYAWADIRQMFTFSINHDVLLNDINNTLLRDAISEASDDFICSLV